MNKSYLTVTTSLLLLVFLIWFLTNFGITESKAEESFPTSCKNVECENPVVIDPNLDVKMLFQIDFKFGPNELSSASTMTFVGKDILILNKNNGTMYRIKNSSVLGTPLIDLNVANERERGLLGIAYYKNNNDSEDNIFLYVTESAEKDGSDFCPTNKYCVPSGNAMGNRVYKYDLGDNELENPRLLLDLPAEPGPSHNGGVIKIGPDKNLYVTVGDVVGFANESTRTKVQNYKDGSSPDGRAGILRMTPSGNAVAGIIGKEYPLNLYYAYGIRNSFGMDFDPLTSNLWDTENGPEYGDELNLVNPGFNSGWGIVQGIWMPTEADDPNLDKVAGDMVLYPKDLVDFGGNGKYSPPEFVWKDAIGISAVKFLTSDKLGEIYQNDLFVGSFSLGTIFHFDLNPNRTGLQLYGALNDKIADNLDELQEVTFSKGLGKISDIEVGPDGYIYVLSLYMKKLTIFKIAP